MNHQSSDIGKLFVEAAGSFAEAIYIDQASETNAVNVFGRSLRVLNQGGLPRLLGIASAGIRTAACLPADKLMDSLSALRSFARMHVPFTLVIEGGALGYLPDLARTEVIIFQAFSKQELSDRILMAQVISEKCLVPVVVLSELADSESEFSLPGVGDLRDWFGDNDGRVEDPTPAQAMVQGRMRRRVPAWIHTDNPVMLDARRNYREKLVNQAARVHYDWSHVNEIITDTQREFHNKLGRKYTSWQLFNVDRARNFLLSTAAFDQPLTDKLLSDKEIRKSRTGLIRLSQLWPIDLPREVLNQKSGGLLVLEPAVYHGDQGWLYKEIISSSPLRASDVQNGWYVDSLTSEGLHRAILNLNDSATPVKKYWLDLSLHARTSALPKYQLLLESLNRNYPDNKFHSLVPEAVISQPETPPIPLASRQFSDKGAPFSRLSDFYNHTACLYDYPQLQVVNPFNAISVLPTATAIYHQPGNRTEVPVFKPVKLRAVDRYPGACPHGALLSGLFTIQELIKSGIAQARSRGESISLIVPLSKVWAKNAAQVARDKRGKLGSVKDLLSPAFEPTLATAKKDPEAIQAEYELIMTAIGDIPVALTDKHYYQREEEKADTGELFTLAVDPSACTGCGTCVLATNEAALEMKLVEEVSDSDITRTFNQYEALTETNSTIIARLIEDEDFDPFAALLLNKTRYRSLHRGGVTWEKSAETASLGLLTALAEEQVTKRFEGIIKQISVQTAGINNAIKKLLSDSLPVTRLESLMDVLTRHSEEKINMDRIFEEWGREQQFKSVKKEELERKLEVLEGLKQLKWALAEGLNSRGRAPYSIVLDQSVDYLGEHPWNPFNVPVIRAGENNSAELALGVFEGQLRNTLDNLRLLRRAQLESAGKYNPEEHNQQIASLTWENLTDEEKALVTPVFLLGTEKILTEGSLSSMMSLFEEKDGYPVKVIALESGSFDPVNALVEINARNSALWPIMAQNKAFVGRGSLADANYLFKLASESIDFDGPAVLSVFTPDAFAYDSLPALWPQLTALAESCRVALPQRYRPSESNMAERIELKFQDINDDWTTTNLNCTINKEEVKLPYALTFADYAFMLKAWKPHFTRLESDENTLPVAEYLNLEPAKAESVVSVIKRVNKDNHLVSYSVSEQVIKATMAVRSHFRLLREWAGLYTAFPEKLREETHARLRTEYEAEKTKLKAELDEEKTKWQAEHIRSIKQQMKDRLLQLTGQK